MRPWPANYEKYESVIATGLGTLEAFDQGAFNSAVSRGKAKKLTSYSIQILKSMDMSNLRLLPQFNKRDPNIFLFCLSVLQRLEIKQMLIVL